MIDALAPSAAGDEQLRSWFARLERLAASPGRMRRLVAALAADRPAPDLGAISAPTLVLHRTHDAFIDVRHSREYARRIPGARLVELPGVDSLPSVGDSDALLGEIEEFLTGGRRGAERERALLTVLFSDIVGSTELVAELGDKRWRDLLGATTATCAARCAASTGACCSASATASSRSSRAGPAARCAARGRCARRRALGMQVRIGLHTGECEVIGDDIVGMAVHIAARIGALAAARRDPRLGHDVRHDRRRGPGLRLPRRAPPQGRVRTLAGVRAQRVTRRGRRHGARRGDPAGDGQRDRRRRDDADVHQRLADTDLDDRGPGAGR